MTCHGLNSVDGHKSESGAQPYRILVGTLFKENIFINLSTAVCNFQHKFVSYFIESAVYINVDQCDFIRIFRTMCFQLFPRCQTCFFLLPPFVLFILRKQRSEKELHTKNGNYDRKREIESGNNKKKRRKTRTQKRLASFSLIEVYAHLIQTHCIKDWSLARGKYDAKTELWKCPKYPFFKINWPNNLIS